MASVSTLARISGAATAVSTSNGSIFVRTNAVVRAKARLYYRAAARRRPRDGRPPLR
jgi:hypothetical protein